MSASLKVLACAACLFVAGAAQAADTDDAQVQPVEISAQQTPPAAPVAAADAAQPVSDAQPVADAAAEPATAPSPPTAASNPAQYASAAQTSLRVDALHTDHRWPKLQHCIEDTRTPDDFQTCLASALVPDGTGAAAAMLGH